MALLVTTNLETHPVTTTNINGIVNGNWERLEAIFLALGGGTTDMQIGWNSGTKVFTARAGSAALVYSATPALNFLGATTQTIVLTGNAVFSSSNLAAGRKLTLVITCDGTGRTIGFPAGWRWVGSVAPTAIAASKIGKVEILSTTTIDSGVVARWVVEP